MQNTGSRELFGEISDESDVEIDETEPPGSSEVSLPPGQPRKTPHSTSNTSAERAAQLTGWDDIARPIDQTDNPCEKRRIEKHLAVRSLSAPPTHTGSPSQKSPSISLCGLSSQLYVRGHHQHSSLNFELRLTVFSPFWQRRVSSYAVEQISAFRWPLR